MKKKHLAVAVSGALAVLAAPASFAQSTVSISGNIDVGVTSNEVNLVKQTTMHSGLASTSKLIIQGTEDIGGGLKARFYTETGLAATTHLLTSASSTTAGNTNYLVGERTSTLIGDRGIFVGLQGPFGEIQAGHIAHQTGAFAIGMGGVQNALANAAGAGGAHPGQNSDVLLSSQAEARANNSALWITPRVNGLQGKVQYSLGGGSGDGSQGNRTTWVGNYTQGPVAVEAMTSRRRAYDAGSATATGNTPAQTSSYSLYNASNEIKEYSFGAKYDLQVVALGFGWVKQTTLPTTTFKANGIGVTVPLGAFTLAGGYASHRPSGGGASYNSKSGSVQYALSKRTTAYAALRANNQASGKDKLSVFGVNHTF